MHHFFETSGASLRPRQGEPARKIQDTERAARQAGSSEGEGKEKGTNRKKGKWTVRKAGESRETNSNRRPETLKEVVQRQGSLLAGYKVLERLSLEQTRGGKPLSAKFFSLLMALCVDNIRAGRATMTDAHAVMQRSVAAGVEPDTILFNALLAAVAQEAGHGRASLADATAVMRQLRAAGLRPDVHTMNTLMDVTAKVAASRSDFRDAKSSTEGRLGELESAPVTPMSGQSILRLMRAEGLAANVWTYTSLLSLYAKCAARGAGHVSLSDALKVREEMAAEGVAPTLPLINNYMSLVAKLAHNAEAELVDGYKVLDYADAFSIRASVLTLNALTDVAASAALRGKASFADAIAVLERMRACGVKADRMSFNTALNALANCVAYSLTNSAVRAIRDPVNDPVNTARSLFRSMEEAGITADVVTYSSLLNVCAKAIEAGQATVEDADAVMELMRSRKMLVIDTLLSNTFLECARADGSPAALLLAEDMLSQMRAADCDSADSYTYSSMMLLYGKALGAAGGQKAEAMLLDLRQRGECNTYLFNAAMQANLPERPAAVLRLGSLMRQDGIEEDRRTAALLREAALAELLGEDGDEEDQEGLGGSRSGGGRADDVLFDDE
jgi:hypothetical protein